MKIAFDAAKRVRTLVERGLDFASASEVFSGRHMTVEDDRRIVSMRKANDRERKIYADRLAGSG